MTTDDFYSVIDAAAQTLITADIHNLQDLTKLYTCFQKISGHALHNNSGRIAAAADAAAALTKKMMLDEAEQQTGVMDVLSKTVSTMQQMLLPGSRQQQYAFPETLPIAYAEIPASGQTAFSLPAHIDEDIFTDFLNDQDNVLERLEAHLLRLEKNTDQETLADLRRIFHTLKGESGIFELNDIQKLCHMTEDLIDASGARMPIDTLLVIKDWLKTVFDALKNRSSLPALSDRLLALVQAKSPAAQQQAAAQTNDYTEDVVFNRNIPPAAVVQNREKSLVNADMDLLSDFVAEVQEHIDTIDARLLSLEHSPQDPDMLNAIFRLFHTIKGAAGFLSLDDIARLAHTTENLLDLSRKGEITFTAENIDIVFEAVDEMKKLVGNIGSAIAKGAATYLTDPSLDNVIENIQRVTSLKKGPAPQEQAVPQAAVAEERSPQPAVEQPCPERKKLLEKPPQLKRATEQNTQDMDSAFSIQKVVLATQEGFTTSLPQQKGKIKESIKVDSENLDKLIDAIGELVIIESMIKQDNDLKGIASSTLIRNITQMDKITRELQQLGMALRMIPVRATFQKMARVVRDLAKKSGKNIEFVSSGEETMLDKSVVDRIGDPLIHLVRNSVDHGIEKSSEQRLAAGKDSTGKIELTAFHKGGNIYIEIKDDGRGLNKNSIIDKAKEKGLLREGQSLSDREIFNFIFLPGFSTAQKVTDVSGRGVGMDVVKRTIEDLRGNIDIISEPGAGTTFSLRLPLTLAIIDGMLVRIGAERYIIPTLSIVEAVRPKPDDIATIVNRGEMIKIRDKLIPLFRLARLFKIENAQQNPAGGIVIVVEDSGKMTGILVDELLGQQSTVIKSLGAFMKGLVGISGGSIMSDGKVGIIVDIAGIVKLAAARQDIVER